MTRSKTKAKKSEKGQSPTARSTWDERVIRSLIPWRREILGLIIFVVSVISLLALIGLTRSGLLAPWTDLLRQIAGWGVYLLCITGIVLGIYIMIARMTLPVRVKPGQVVGFELIFLIVLAISHLWFGNGLGGALAGEGGGLIGWALSEPIFEFFGPLLTFSLYMVLFVIGIALLLSIGWTDLVGWLNRSSLNLQRWSSELEIDLAVRESQRQSLDLDNDLSANTTSEMTPEIRINRDELIIIEDSVPDQLVDSTPRDPNLPSVELLDEGAVLALSTEEIDLKKRIIEQTLADFGLPAVVTEIRRGPTVTQFGVLPGYIERPGPDGQTKQYKVRVSQIASLQRDLALALAVPRLRIEAPVPGRGIVGIEVPNSETSIVRLRSILESQTYNDLNSSLSMALGRDVAGAPVATDLSTLPHLLIAGTTGSGKSVCLNALISCLTFNNSPERLRIVMIDPKKVELIRFNGLPHLIGKVETDPDRVIGVLRWLTTEMDRRYELFAQVGAKHLNDYNRKLARRSAAKQTESKPLPFIAVIIDELADLMVAYPGDAEQTLCRLAQMARATGMHMIVATQRPSTDVITGLIKANFPARASFAVASGIDSRVILDTIGAENLLGKGDMLFLPPNASAPKRIQGCFVSDSEIEAIVNHWQQSFPQPESLEKNQAVENEAPWEKLIARKTFISDRDEMLEQAIAIAQKHDRISTSLIQRRLRVGYPRAARLMESLYEMGLVDHPKEGGKTRKTYVEDQEDPLNDYLESEN